MDDLTKIADWIKMKLPMSQEIIDERYFPDQNMVAVSLAPKGGYSPVYRATVCPVNKQQADEIMGKLGFADHMTRIVAIPENTPPEQQTIYLLGLTFERVYD